MACVAAIARRVAMRTARSVPTRVGFGPVDERGFGDEDDVDVADVVELARAGLAHRDDRERRRSDVGLGERDLATGDRHRRLERGTRQVGEARGHGGERVGRRDAQHVEQGDLREVAPVADPEPEPGVLTHRAVDRREQ